MNRSKNAAAHTPGPWKFETVPTSIGICHKIGPFPTERARKPYTWACVYVDGLPPGEGAAAEELHANARLIAAAPELLAALEEYRAKFGRCGDVADRADAVIKKARGDD